jgi:hypothetical protein
MIKRYHLPIFGLPCRLLLPSSLLFGSLKWKGGMGLERCSYDYLDVQAYLRNAGDEENQTLSFLNSSFEVN